MHRCALTCLGKFHTDCATPEQAFRRVAAIGEASVWRSMLKSRVAIWHRNTYEQRTNDGKAAAPMNVSVYGGRSFSRTFSVEISRVMTRVVPKLLEASNEFPSRSMAEKQTPKSTASRIVIWIGESTDGKSDHGTFDVRRMSSLQNSSGRR